MTRWVLRLLLLPLFLVREIWRRWARVTENARIIRRGGYTGGPVAVVALYQQGQVRADVLGLLLALRRSGTHVIAVNAGELSDAGARLPVDTYVERRNYGRDFASYQIGVGLAMDCDVDPDRMLLLNDSVFYASKGLEGFLNRLLHSSADVCSATESLEVLPHQTSFCLSFSRACVKHPRFQRFWRRYVATDLRPMTVLFGEVALSQVLRAAGLTRETLASRHAVDARLELQQIDGAGVTVNHAESRVSGNMTHRAPDVLLDLGVPIVKLDLAHRAGKTDSELEHILGRLEPVDSQSLGELWRIQREKKHQDSRLDRLGAICGLA